MEGGGPVAARWLRVPRGLCPRHRSAPAARQRRLRQQLVVCCPEPGLPEPHDGPPASGPRGGSGAARVDGFVRGVPPQVSPEGGPSPEGSNTPGHPRVYINMHAILNIPVSGCGQARAHRKLSCICRPSCRLRVASGPPLQSESPSEGASFLNHILPVSSSTDRRQAPRDSHLNAKGFDWKPRTLSGYPIAGDAEGVEAERRSHVLALEAELSRGPDPLHSSCSMPEWNDGSGCRGGPPDEAGTRPHIPRLNLARVRGAPPDTRSVTSTSGRGMPRSYSADGFPNRPSSAAAPSWDRAETSGPAGDGGFGGPGGGFAPALPGPPGSSGSAAAGLWGLAPSEPLYGTDESAWVDGRSSPHAALRPDVIASHQSAWGHMSEDERADAARYYARLSGLYTERLGMVRGWTRRGARIAALVTSHPSSVDVTASTSFAAGLRDAVEGARCSMSERAHSAPGACPQPPQDPRSAGTFRRCEGASAAPRASSAVATWPMSLGEDRACQPARSAGLHRDLALRPLSNTIGTPRQCPRPPSCHTPRSTLFDSPAIASLASAGYIQCATWAGPQAGSVSGPAATGTLHTSRSSLPSAHVGPSFVNLQLLDGAGNPGWVARTAAGPPSSPRGRLLSGSPAGRHTADRSLPSPGVRARQASARAGIDSNGAMRVAAHPPAMPKGDRAGWHTTRA